MNKNFSICITTFEQREELCYSLIRSIKEIQPDINIVVAINANNDSNINEQYRERFLNFCGQTSNCYPIFCPEFKSLSKLWNTLVIFSSTDYNVILNDDVVIMEKDSLQRIERAINETDHEIFTINGGWSHFVITKQALDRVGYFDERLIAFGEEDGDLVYRYEERYNMHIPTLAVGGIRNICAYEKSSINLETHVDNKPRINREIVMLKYTEDANSKICGMHSAPIRKRLSDNIQYPYEMFFRENRHNIKSFKSIDFSKISVEDAVSFDIKSEDPMDHWSFLNVKNKRVLDLGCGRWEAKELEKTTPLYFLASGAAAVVGVDINEEEISFFKDQNISNTEFICVNLDSIDKLMSIINQYKIQSIKMDIEGHEGIILNASTEDFKDIESIAIEYHITVPSYPLIQKLKEFGFTIKYLGKLWVENMGVIFAEK
jgi:hypothetical protein